VGLLGRAPCEPKFDRRRSAARRACRESNTSALEPNARLVCASTSSQVRSTKLRTSRARRCPSRSRSHGSASISRAALASTTCIAWHAVATAPAAWLRTCGRTGHHSTLNSTSNHADAVGCITCYARCWPDNVCSKCYRGMPVHLPNISVACRGSLAVSVFIAACDYAGAERGNSQRGPRLSARTQPDRSRTRAPAVARLALGAACSHARSPRSVATQCGHPVQQCR
jgi:hypothetical protein